ncbi:site-specific DNA-methyltransferase [uncultured Thalassospira sp.]|mgnify:CR=1 FL=1|uniref:DNA-methyltransferase n=1 Tax=uncultured Thalassospira sp. TaxID=404382 RepID=UPI0030DD7635|tara:strand:+ start:15874 stop:16947 length:1074 start_codon:yes stop_codon:yes gene_type:complete
MGVQILIGDAVARLKGLPDQSVNCCVTSPPYYGLRDYGMPGQIGLEETPGAFIARLVDVFREVRRVLRDDGTLWVNLGDSYASKPNGSIGRSTLDGTQSGQAEYRRTNARRKSRLPGGLKHKDLMGMPWRLAFALQDDGWYLRQDIIWAKPNPMPESVRDRCTKSHEYMFLLTKKPRYYFDRGAISEPVAPASVARLAQDIENQAGSDRVVGKSNGRMKAVTRSKRDSFKREDSKRCVAHPGQTMGTHRPDRDDGQWDIAKRNKRSVWNVATIGFKEAHFATFPLALIEPCILAGCPVGGVVLDPFGGAGTTGLVAGHHGRDAILCELNPEYAALSARRIKHELRLFADVDVSAEAA